MSPAYDFAIAARTAAGRDKNAFTSFAPDT